MKECERGNGSCTRVRAAWRIRPRPPAMGLGAGPASKCVRAGNPEFPVNRIYADKAMNTRE